jgi:hypothetical protein
MKNNRIVVKCKRSGCQGYGKNIVSVASRYVSFTEAAAVADLTHEQEVRALPKHNENPKPMLLKKGEAVGLLQATTGGGEHMVQLVQVNSEPSRLQIDSLKSMDTLTGANVLQIMNGLAQSPPSLPIMTAVRALPDYDPEEDGAPPARSWVVGGLGFGEIPFICITICALVETTRACTMGYKLERADAKQLPTPWRRESVRAFRESPLGAMYFYSCCDERDGRLKGCSAVCADEYFQELV